MSFTDKIVLITGAGSGIGRELALAYFRNKAIVLAIDRHIETVMQTVSEIKNKGARAFAFHADISRPEEIEQLFKDIKKQFGHLDILINNAGISKFKSPYELSLDEWDEIINTNLRSVFLCSREAAAIMREGKGGSIVNIASTRALMSEPGSEAYAASKGGMIALTHALAASLSKDNIQINCISPGWIETVDYDALSPKDHSLHFSGRVGHPDDIAKACLYLTQAGNNFINGTNLIIDGGMTRKMIY